MKLFNIFFIKKENNIIVHQQYLFSTSVHPRHIDINKLKHIIQGHSYLSLNGVYQILLSQLDRFINDESTDFIVVSSNVNEPAPYITYNDIFNKFSELYIEKTEYSHMEMFIFDMARKNISKSLNIENDYIIKNLYDSYNKSINYQMICFIDNKDDSKYLKHIDYLKKLLDANYIYNDYHIIYTNNESSDKNNTLKSIEPILDIKNIFDSNNITVNFILKPTHNFIEHHNKVLHEIKLNI